VCYYVEGVFVFDKRQQVQSCYVLDRVFVLDMRAKLSVGKYAAPYIFYLGNERCVCAAEVLARHAVGCVEYRSVGEHYAYGAEHTVAVGVGAAFHAGGIVGHDASHHGRLFRCRVGCEHSSVRLEYLADAGTDYAGLQCYGSGLVVEDSITFPRLSGHEEY
jgi:hypothetical protein